MVRTMIEALDYQAPNMTKPQVKGESWRKGCAESVDVTLYQWRDDDRRRVVLKFGTMPAAPVRFRCTGTFTKEYPQRFRVELARAMDSMPQLDPREIKQLGEVLELAIANQLGMEVAPISPGRIDVEAM